ncbi:MAG: hypothetical protein M3132_07620 [Actinomycetia bacterium]|nr:hypothetical protein [Actinomycetes bacterium]
MADSTPTEIEDSADLGIAAGGRRPTGTQVSKWFVVGAIATSTLLIFLTMSGLYGQLLGQVPADGQSIWRVPDLFVANTPTGGDMGAHVLLPKILLEDLLPSGRLHGWSMDWFAGFPAMYFYFPLPALATVVLDLVLPYGVAFKLATIAGLVVLPTVAYFFVKYLGFTKFVAAIAGVAGSLFVFMESYSIFGANIKSTLTGEFSYGWSFALSILYVGMVVRNYRQDKSFDPWAGIVLGLTAMAHVVTTIVVVIATLPLVLSPILALVRRTGDIARSMRHSTGVLWTYAIGFGLSAFWSVALGINVLQGMTADMGWEQVTALVGNNEGLGSPVPWEFVPVLFLGLIGMAWTLRRRDNVGVAIWMTVFPLGGYFLIARLDLTVIYNARLLPYWFFGMYVFAGITTGLMANAVGRRVSRMVRMSLVGVVAIVAMIAGVVLSIDDIPGWVNWDYGGYEGKQVWSEYENLMQTVDELPDGRIMWETNEDMSRYGTDLALMLFPFWSEGHPSMGGLFYESSLTTPFHFLNTSEVSAEPTISTKGLTYLNYRSMDFERAVVHLAVYDVAYYVSFTEEGTSAALDHGLDVLVEPAPWTVFALPDADMVDVAKFEPVVWAGEEDFSDAALEWYDDIDNLDVWLVQDGPEEWRRVTSVGERLEVLRPYPITGTATLSEFTDQTVSFTTDALGVPHLVKVSYFPNWTVDGADGVYRAAPSLMIVVPDDEYVTLKFEYRWIEILGFAITAMTLVGLATYGFVETRRRREESYRDSISPIPADTP